MTTPIMFPDPRAAVLDVLREALPRFGVEAKLGVREVPGETGDWPIPYVQVASDGKYRDSRLNGRATIRVLCYGTDSGDGERIAAIAEAILLSELADGPLRGCSSIMGPRPTTDPDNGLPFSYFTVTARLRPMQL